MPYLICQSKPNKSLHFPVGSHAEATYLDVLVDILLRLVQSYIQFSRQTLSSYQSCRLVQAEPKAAWVVTMQSSNAVIQSTSIDLLQVIVARGEIDSLLVDNVEAAIIGKLYFCIHGQRLDLQNKLLHILHSLISASSSNMDTPPLLNRNLRSGDGASEDHSTQEGSQDDGRHSYAVNPLLVQTLVDGIATLSNRPVLQHWLDFILMAVPQFQPTLQSVVSPLNDCVCRQLRLSLADILRASQERREAEDISSAATDAEFIMLLNALERLIQLSLANVDTNQLDEDHNILDKAGTENSGLLGYVSNVFGSESVTNPTDDQAIVSVNNIYAYIYLDEQCLIGSFRWLSLATRRCSCVVFYMGHTFVVQAFIVVIHR